MVRPSGTGCTLRGEGDGYHVLRRSLARPAGKIAAQHWHDASTPTDARRAAGRGREENTVIRGGAEGAQLWAAGCSKGTGCGWAERLDERHIVPRAGHIDREGPLM